MKNRLGSYLLSVFIFTLICVMSGINGESSVRGEELSEEIRSFQLAIDGEIYQFPMPYHEFAGKGWTYSWTNEDADEFSDTRLLSEEMIIRTFTYGETFSIIYIKNYSVNTLNVSDCYVYGISFVNYQYLYDGLSIELSGGIQFADATEEEIRKQYGEPSEVDNGEYSDTLKYYAENDNSKIEFDFNKDGTLYRVNLENDTCPDGYIESELENAQLSVPSEEALFYQIPEKLGESILDNTVEFCGDLYHIPSPVSAFVANGWNVVSDLDDGFLRGREDGSVLLRRNNQERSFRIQNLCDNAVSVENAFITELEDTKGKNDELTISGDLKMQSDWTEVLDNARQSGLLVRSGFYYFNSSVQNYYCYIGFPSSDAEDDGVMDLADLRSEVWVKITSSDARFHDIMGLTYHNELLPGEYVSLVDQLIPPPANPQVTMITENEEKEEEKQETRIQETEEPETEPQESEEWASGVLQSGTENEGDVSSDAAAYDIAVKSEYFRSDELPLPRKDYTILVYMIGSNLESRFGFATRDIEEMVNSGFDFERNNLLVCTGGSQRWFSNVACKQNSVLDLKYWQSENPYEKMVGFTETSVSMGSGEMLAEFIRFGQENYPADHYALIFWDHGGGPVYGFGMDENNKKDSLGLKELSDGLKKGLGSGVAQNRFDWIGFDACLMANLETALTLEPYTPFLVASQELEPGAGWDYSFLSEINDESDTDIILSSILTSYQDYFEKKAKEGRDYEYTLSCLDLSKAKTAADALDQVAEQLSENMNTGYRSYVRCRYRTKAMANSSGKADSNSYELVDLYSMAEQLSKQEMSRDSSALEKLMDAIGGLVKKRVGNVAHVQGVSVYYPYANINAFDDSSRIYEVLPVLDDYAEFIRMFMQQKNREQIQREVRHIYTDDIKKDKEGFILKLEPDQVDEIEWIEYDIVFSRDNGRSFTPVLTGVPLSVEEDGTCRIPSTDSMTVYTAVMDGIEQPVLLPARVREEFTDLGVVSRKCMTISTFINDDWDNGLNGEFVNLTFTVQDGEEPVIREVLLDESDASDPDGKLSLDLENWSVFNIMFINYPEETDKNGNIKSFRNMNSSSISVSTRPADEMFSVESIYLSQLNMDFSVQLQVHCADGSSYTSDYIPLGRGATDTQKDVPRQVSGEVDGFLMTFWVTDDSATLTSCERLGSISTVHVPDEWEGHPVKRIGVRCFRTISNIKEVVLPEGIEALEYEAFDSCTGLEKINIPSTVTFIGTRCFAHCKSLKELKLPSSLTRLGDGFAYGCTALKRFTLEEGCIVYRMQNSLLYTVDGKTLVACPILENGILKIPDGTKKIADMAVDYPSGERLEEVVLPDGIMEIGQSAFALNPALKMPDLPDSLISIGKDAFNYSGWDTRPVTVFIGSGLDRARIGENALACDSVGAFEVSAKNHTLSVIDGVLMDKMGESVVQEPLGAK